MSSAARSRLQVATVGPEGEGGAVVLHENESIRAEKRQDLEGGRTIVLRRVSASPRVFVRGLAPQSKFVDLLDIVAGGDGAGRRRELGIDSLTGWEDRSFISNQYRGDGKYHPTTVSKLIDGVFTFDGTRHPVQLDSAGHTFDGFPATDGLDGGSIWRGRRRFDRTIVN